MGRLLANDEVLQYFASLGEKVEKVLKVLLEVRRRCWESCH